MERKKVSEHFHGVFVDCVGHRSKERRRKIISS